MLKSEGGGGGSLPVGHLGPLSLHFQHYKPPQLFYQHQSVMYVIHVGRNVWGGMLYEYKGKYPCMQ